MRYNEDNNLNKNLWKILFLLLCLSQLHSRHLSSPFLVSIPLAFAIHSLQRRCTAQEERVNAQQFLPPIPCPLLFFMPLVFSSCLFLLHWCVSYRGCSPFQCVPALVWVTRGLNSPQMHTCSCTSFSVSSSASSCLSTRDILRVSFCVSSHATYSYISSRLPLCLQWLPPLLKCIFAEVPGAVLTGSCFGAWWVSVVHCRVSWNHPCSAQGSPWPPPMQVTTCSSLLPKFCWICPVQAMILAATYFHFFLCKSYKKRKAWIFSYFYFKFCFFRLSENMIIISVCISTCNEWSDLL